MFTKKTRVISAIATVCMLISMLACIAVPAYAEDLSSYPSVTTVTSAAERTGTDYTVANATEWMHLYNNAAHFQSTDVTIHIIGEIDMTGQTGFASIYNPAFSLDGHGNTIKNWGTAAAPQKTMGMFRFSSGAGMNFIKNLTLDNCHTTGSGGSDSTLLVTLAGADNTGRPNMSANFVMENVHIKNSSLTAEAARSGFFIANYVKSDGDYSVTLKNCSLTGSTLHGTTNGHSGLLIGKASSFNGKKATYNLTNVYVAGNTMNAKRGDNYVGLGVGNVEVNSNAIAPMVFNINNVVFENNTYNHVGTEIGLFGNMVCTAFNAKGLVMEDNTTTTTATETGRYIFKSAAASTALNMSGVYCNDTAVTAAAKDTTATGAKLADSFMTSGEAASAANTAASSDSLFWYTTTADGLAKGDATNATRKVELQLGTGEVVGTYYANVGATVEVAYAEKPDASFEIKGETGSINGNVVTVTENKDVVVAVGLTPAEELANAKAVLQVAINYFKVDRNINYFNDTVKTAVAEAEALMAGEDIAAILAKKDALDALQGTNYAGTKENAPSMTEIAKYPGAPVYVIRTAADFQAMEDNKGLFDTDDTVYMMNDIDMKGSTFNGVEAFKASFDGQGYTIKNWGIAADGTTKAAISTRGFFFNTYGAAAAIKSIKNVSFENCHTIGQGTAAMLYGVGHANAGMSAAGAATTLTMENIHFNGCSITAPSAKHEVVAFLLARYTVAGKNTTVNVKNCSVVGSTLDYDGTDAGGGHFGLLIGKPRNGNAGETTVYNLTDCYVGGNTVEYSRADGNYTGVVFGTAEAMGDFTVNIKNLGVVDNTIKVGGTHIALVGDVQGTKTNVDGLLVEGNTATGGSMVLFNNGSAVTLKNTFCSDTLSKVTTGSATLTGTKTDAAAAYAVNTVSGGNLWWTTTDDAAVKGAATNATRKVELKLGTGEVVGTYYANVGETVTVAYAEEPGAEFSIVGESGTIADSNKVTVNKNADVVVAVSLGSAQELANAKEALQAAINYYKVDRNINYYKAEVATAVTEAEALLESTDTAAILAKVEALNGMKGEFVDAYPNVPSISEMSKYPAMKNYKIMTADELIAADTAALRADGITLHLGANINMSGKDFNGFDSASFDFDGHNYTISNWTHANTIGFISNYQGGTFKNVTFDTCSVGGGYGRALLAGNNTAGNTVFENVHVKNVVVAENSQGNLGGIFFGQFVSASYTGTVRNCSVINTEIKSNCTGGEYGITNSGIICGRASHGTTYVVENIYVDGFKNNANNTEFSMGNGILFGTIEGGLAAITVDGAIIINCDGHSAYEIAAWAYNDKPVTIKNVLAAGNNTRALFGAGVATTQLTYENVITDTEVLFALFESNSTPSAHKSEQTTMAGATVMDASAFKTGEAAYKLNAAAGKTLALVNDSFNAYPVMFATEGYAAPKAVTFKDVSDNNKVVATLYTNGSGKLNAAELSALEGDAYDWKLADADVTAETVFVADSVVTSNVSHDWENGTYEQLENGQHKLICGDEGCEVYKIEDCATYAVNHRLDGEKHIHDVLCACEKVLDTEDCQIEIEGVGADGKHTIGCEGCGFADQVDCVFTGWAHDDATVGENATHTGTCACGATKTAACSFGDWTPVNAADLGVCGVEKKVCADCGYEYTRTSAMLTETFIEIVSDTVDSGAGATVEIYANIDEIGLAGGKVIVSFDSALEWSALELGEGFAFIEDGDEVVDGDTTTFEIIFANDENLSGKVLLATIGFIAPATAGTYEVDVEVEDAVVISGDNELPADVTGASSAVFVREAMEGDVNGDGVVTIADAVLALRVASGKLDAAEISFVGANVVDTDEEITTADAVAILRMVMEAC